MKRSLLLLLLLLLGLLAVGSAHRLSPWLRPARRFPDLKALSGYAASKDILLGWYENNCVSSLPTPPFHPSAFSHVLRLALR